MADKSGIPPAIPPRFIELARDLGKLAVAKGLKKISATISPGFDDPDHWPDDVFISWEEGRHGEDMDRIFVQSTVRVWERIGNK